MKTKIKISQEEIKQLYVSGVPQDAIAHMAGVTRQRVQQLLSDLGIARKDGGQAKHRAIKAAIRKAVDDERHTKRWGMARAELRALRAQIGRHPFSAFTQQKKNSKKRGIAFRLNFAQWWRIWQESGRWGFRGRGHGYVMTRRGDRGAYEEGNVSIKTQVANMLEYHSEKGSSTQRAEARV